MGEYARYNGTEVKIGTCEDMYYLRADQRKSVVPMSGSLDPDNHDTLEVIRFRFPFPDEDGIAPGHFEDYNRGLSFYLDLPEDIEHHKRQFTTEGYNVMLPCPESKEGKSFGFHRNGNPGPYRLVQQAFRGGILVTICECYGCGTAFRLPTLKDATPLIEKILEEATMYRDSDSARALFYIEVARRIIDGYYTKLHDNKKTEAA